MKYQQPKDWEKWLTFAKWWYNTSFHSTIRLTPFEVLYGIKPSQLALGPYQQSNVTAVEELLQERSKLDQKLKENLSQVRARMKQYANKYRTERTFNEGDFVSSISIKSQAMCQVLWSLSSG